MSPEDRLRTICLALPEATEIETWGDATFRVRGKIFAMIRRDDGRLSFWCKAPPGSQAILVEADPARFFAPPYVGPKGWVGMRIDDGPDWAEVEHLVRRSWGMTAPRKLAVAAGLAPTPASRPRPR